MTIDNSTTVPTERADRLPDIPRLSLEPSGTSGSAVESVARGTEASTTGEGGVADARSATTDTGVPAETAGCPTTGEESTAPSRVDPGSASVRRTTLGLKLVSTTTAVGGEGGSSGGSRKRPASPTGKVGGIRQPQKRLKDMTSGGGDKPADDSDSGQSSGGSLESTDLSGTTASVGSIVKTTVVCAEQGAGTVESDDGQVGGETGETRHDEGEEDEDGSGSSESDMDEDVDPRLTALEWTDCYYCVKSGSDCRSKGKKCHRCTDKGLACDRGMTIPDLRKRQNGRLQERVYRAHLKRWRDHPDGRRGSRPAPTVDLSLVKQHKVPSGLWAEVRPAVADQRRRVREQRAARRAGKGECRQGIETAEGVNPAIQDLIENSRRRREHIEVLRRCTLRLMGQTVEHCERDVEDFTEEVEKAINLFKFLSREGTDVAVYRHAVAKTARAKARSVGASTTISASADAGPSGSSATVSGSSEARGGGDAGTGGSKDKGKDKGKDKEKSKKKKDKGKEKDKGKGKSKRAERD